MIARARIKLPFSLVVAEEGYDTFEEPFGQYRMRVFPLYKASMENEPRPGETIDFREIRRGLAPRQGKDDLMHFSINGAEAHLVDALQIDFLAPTFNRTNQDGAQEPSIALILEAANGFLYRLRSVIQASVIRPLSEKTLIAVRYLNDDETELQQEEGLVRGHAQRGGRLSFTTLMPQQWRRAGREVNYKPATWETLLLDAEAMLPEIGPAVTLAFAAVETLIVACLDHLGPQRMPAPVWTWINDRDEKYEKQPSIKERLGVLLEALSGESLKKQQPLWQGFTQLYNARNSFVHSGRCTRDKDGLVEVTVEGARELVAKTACDIVRWLERFVPVEARSIPEPVSRDFRAAIVIQGVPNAAPPQAQ
jgi:hypothetical protein